MPAAIPPRDKVAPSAAPAVRGLARGLEVLRAFRPGSALLGNGDIAERTGLSKSTVSRLTQTLVHAGMLQFDVRSGAYRLAPAVLSFAHAMRTGSRVLEIAAPAMRALAEARRINVGLAAADRDEMVYLESVRYSRRVALRTVVSGQRVPMELTSLGRAYLSTLDEDHRRALFAHFMQRRGTQWRRLRADIEAALQDVARRGYCAAAWQPEVVALAAPLQATDGTYVLNVSISTEQAFGPAVEQLAEPLLTLRAQLQAALDADAEPGPG
ncbi:IclR family transcriptional regulator [Aquincola sp. MAHUQ-54]|uniref:IclR family transcriptional regulator n=1 Tax=Aquincola agrisoli TaxID=3119538 RepID=A0AAW9Q8N1_9BURK